MVLGPFWTLVHRSHRHQRCIKLCMKSSHRHQRCIKLYIYLTVALVGHPAGVVSAPSGDSRSTSRFALGAPLRGASPRLRRLRNRLRRWRVYIGGGVAAFGGRPPSADGFYSDSQPFCLRERLRKPIFEWLIWLQTRPIGAKTAQNHVYIP